MLNCLVDHLKALRVANLSSKNMKDSLLVKGKRTLATTCLMETKASLYFFVRNCSSSSSSFFREALDIGFLILTKYRGWKSSKVTATELPFSSHPQQVI